MKKLLVIAFICSFSLAIFMSCSDNKSGQDAEISEQEQLYSLGFFPGGGCTPPFSFSIQRNESCVIEYPYLPDRGLPIDSIYRWREFPDTILLRRLYPSEHPLSVGFMNETAKYLEEHNKKLWDTYLSQPLDVDDSAYPIVTVYIFKNESDSALKLVSFNVLNAERVIYGKYSALNELN